jgi:nitrogenase subunit NifH
MKQRMKVPYGKGVAIRSASSLARGIARYPAKRRQRIGGVGIQLRHNQKSKEKADVFSGR